MKVMQFVKMHKVISAVILVDVILIVAIVVLAVRKFTKTAVMDVSVTPNVAVVEVNGQEYGIGAYRMYPGEVTATIKADGFESKTVTLNLKARETTKVYDFLEATGDNANYYAKNANDAEALARVGGEMGAKLARILSIKKVLPIIEFNYGGLDSESTEIVVDQDLACDATFCLMVTGDRSAGHEKSQNMIREKGYNPEDYKIRYVEH